MAELVCRCGRCALELSSSGYVWPSEVLGWLRGRCRPRLVEPERKRVIAVIGGDRG